MMLTFLSSKVGTNKKKGEMIPLAKKYKELIIKLFTKVKSSERNPNQIVDNIIGSYAYKATKYI